MWLWLSFVLGRRQQARGVHGAVRSVRKIRVLGGDLVHPQEVVCSKRDRNYQKNSAP